MRIKIWLADTYIQLNFIFLCDRVIAARLTLQLDNTQTSAAKQL